MSLRSETKSNAKVIFLTLMWIAVIFVIVFGSRFLYYYTLPFWLGLEREAYTSSHQYQEGHATALGTLHASWVENGCSQRPEYMICKGLRIRARSEAAKLKPGEMSPEQRAWLR